MRSMKTLVVAAFCLVGASLAAQAQYYPQTYTASPPPRPATPPSWSYDPYTSGQAPCPQRHPGDTQSCQQEMPPTYGQPSYWPQR